MLFQNNIPNNIFQYFYILLYLDKTIVRCKISKIQLHSLSRTRQKSALLRLETTYHSGQDHLIGYNIMQLLIPATVVSKIYINVALL